MNKKDEKYANRQLDDQLIHKELSWQSFNQRVLQEAQDRNVPLIERLRFLAIYSNNQDEFFKVRVADLKRQVLIDQSRSSGSSSPNQAAILLKRVQDKSDHLTSEFDETYEKILKELKSRKILFKDYNEISDDQREWIKNFFKRKVKQFISPIVLTEEMNLLSFLKDAYTYLAVEMFNGADKQYALVEIPADKISRIVEIPSARRSTRTMMWLDNIIRVCLDDIFQGFFNYQSIDAYAIKFNRDAEYIPSQELNHSVLENMSEGLKQRLTAIPTRLACDEKMPDAMLATFVSKLKMSGFDSVTRGYRYHNFKDLMSFPDLGDPSLEYAPLEPLHCHDFDRFATMFEAIRERDILLYYPYYTFSYLTEFLRQSSYDPSVIAIKINIYRVASNSMVIKSLLDAANNGKQVTVVVELKARFDESNNIEWAKKLTEAGVKVLFGMHSLKIHSKLCIVTRKENGKLARYCHIGTGNFNEKSARIYTDFALFTRNTDLTREVDDVFDFIEAPYIKPDFVNLMVSPINARARIYELIDTETANASRGLPAAITVKVNNLVDNGVIDRLYTASRAGVKINMVVRGMCTLIPGVAGLSDNIRIISIVDRFLEHPRVMIFHNNGDEKIYISSADWMTRNLDYRIEVATPIFSQVLKQRIKDIIEIQLKDNVKARIIDETQKNEYVKQKKGSQKVRSQMEIYHYLAAMEKEVNPEGSRSQEKARSKRKKKDD